MKTNHGLYQDLLGPIKDKLEQVEAEIDRELQSDIPILASMAGYLGQTKGKRIRPALFLTCCRLLGFKGERDVVFATVIEFIHTATLIHDDIIDGSDTRRGRKTVNAIWGNELTVLLGDYLYLRAVETALAERNLEILDALTEITIRMIEGEIIQLERKGSIQTSEASYMEIVHRKTARLFQGCGRVAAILAGSPPEIREGISKYCFHVGVAFQLIDDVLDFTAESKVLGKPVANDLSEGMATLPLILALQKATETERKTVETMLRTGDPAADERAWVLDLLRKHGSLEATVAVAKHHTLQAVSFLSPFPPSQARDILEALPPFIIDRSF